MIGKGFQMFWRNLHNIFEFFNVCQCHNMKGFWLFMYKISDKIEAFTWRLLGNYFFFTYFGCVIFALSVLNFTLIWILLYSRVFDKNTSAFINFWQIFPLVQATAKLRPNAPTCAYLRLMRTRFWVVGQLPYLPNRFR